MAKTSAGLLMYRMREGEVEVLLGHPGGPFWQRKDDGAWSIPKGEAEDGEVDLLEVAKREFIEETSFTPQGDFISIGTVRNDKSGKVVHAWAFAGDCDPAHASSNTIFVEWPPRSGRQIEVPEVDRVAFFTLVEARKKLLPYLAPLIDAFKEKVLP